MFSGMELMVREREATMSSKSTTVIVPLNPGGRKRNTKETAGGGEGGGRMHLLQLLYPNNQMDLQQKS